MELLASGRREDYDKLERWRGYDNSTWQTLNVVEGFTNSALQYMGIYT